jgi:rod shape-determining protein MreD
VIVRLGVVALLVVALLVVQTAVLPAIAVAGYRPDVVLLLVVAVAVVDGAEPGVRVGFVGGLFTDLLLQSSAVGVAALSYAVVGYVVGLARPYVAPRSLTAPLLLAFGGSLVGQLLLGLLGRVLGGEPAPLRLVMSAAVIVAVLHTLLAPFALRLARSLSARFPAEASSVPR